MVSACQRDRIGLNKDKTRAANRKHIDDSVGVRQCSNGVCSMYSVIVLVHGKLAASLVCFSSNRLCNAD